ncbi:MAG: hypothetical protein HQM09_21895 [Candidatus Riflebacteria bacterium]|nr:hypothetical protein [Candidatus Riflebacteria bacterium]
MMNSMQVSCHNIGGEYGQKLNQTYDLICKGVQPCLIWREPRNMAKPLKGFSGLVEFDHAPLQSGQDLLEARMFFDCGCLYLVEKKDKTYWSLWWEGDTKPGSGKEWLVSLKKVLEYSGVPASSVATLQKTRGKVMLRADTKRIGVNRELGCSRVKADGNSLSVINYTFNGKLLWWRFEK